jgi:serine/threonine protein kinase
MPLADRNLNEIIASERLAEEPLDVIRQSSRKVLNLIHELHSEGVVHGDVKPKNVVRVDRTLLLIDLDMSITVGSSEPVAHSNPEKFSGSTAYAAPELHKWMAEREANDFVDDGTSPLDKLATPQQIDLWSFAVTMYEMASGSPLFQNSYDRATPAALAKLKNWPGLDEEHVSQIESLHGSAESAALRDVRCAFFDRILQSRIPLYPTPVSLEAKMRVTNSIPLGCSLLLPVGTINCAETLQVLLWALDANASSRPKSVEELTTHAFFDPRGGTVSVLSHNFALEDAVGSHACSLEAPALSPGIVPSGRYDLYLGYFRLNNPEWSIPEWSVRERKKSSGRFLPLVPLWQ